MPVRPRRPTRHPALFRRKKPPPGFWTYIAGYTDDVPETDLEIVHLGKRWKETVTLNTNLQYYHEFVENKEKKEEAEKNNNCTLPFNLHAIPDFRTTTDLLPNFQFVIFRRKLPSSGHSTYFPGYIDGGSFCGPANQKIDEKEVEIESGAPDWHTAISKAEKLQYSLEEG